MPLQSLISLDWTRCCPSTRTTPALQDAQHARLYRAHGPFCMPGGFTSIVAVHAAKPVRVSDKPLTMRGTLRLFGHNEDGQILYRLDNAVLT